MDDSAANVEAKKVWVVRTDDGGGRRNGSMWNLSEIEHLRPREIVRTVAKESLGLLEQRDGEVEVRVGIGRTEEKDEPAARYNSSGVSARSYGYSYCELGSLHSRQDRELQQRRLKALFLGYGYLKSADHPDF